MCGIVGRVSRTSGTPIGRALQLMTHRGPDAQAAVNYRVLDWQVELGHTRLAILDLSVDANQPFISADGQQALVFNGEIYNHADLRHEMRGQGVSFRTRSDTEVLLAAHLFGGRSCIPRLNGMFAYALLDLKAKELTLVRDPFGIKPLYFVRLFDGGIAFASELKALSTMIREGLEVDREQIAEFLLNGFLYEPHTGFKGVEKVPPGHTVIFSLGDGKVRISQYDQPSPFEKGLASPRFDEIIERELAAEVEADVPVGVFFSGGVDSTALAVASPRGIQPFHLQYTGGGLAGDTGAATDIAAALSLPLRVDRLYGTALSPLDVVEQFRDVAFGTEEPISDYTFAATRQIARAARGAGFKVMLSGMGGDELFAGYPRHALVRYWSTLKRFSFFLDQATPFLRQRRGWSRRADRLLHFAQADHFPRAYTSLIGYFASDEVAHLMGSSMATEKFFEHIEQLLAPLKGQSRLRQALHLDRHGFLAHNLTVTDRASMAESIEVRVPFLNRAMEQFALACSDRELVWFGSGKRPIKNYLRKHLPRAIIDRPKAAFNPPLDSPVMTIGEEMCRDMLMRGPLSTVLDTSPVQRWVSEHYRRERDHTFRLWQLIYLNFWLEWPRRISDEVRAEH